MNDGFETYATGALDKNLPGGPNAAANGIGNPWWGPTATTTINTTIVGTTGGVTPHSGTQMLSPNTAVTGSEIEWQNLAYRDNGGQKFTGNLRLDVYFYDPNGASNGDAYEDDAGLSYYSDAPALTDYPATSTATLNNSATIDRLEIGAASFRTNNGTGGGTYNATKYQVRITNSQVAGAYNVAGWFNTSVTRTVGWHHAVIDIGGANANGTDPVSFYIDNMTTPVFTGTTVIGQGYNVAEVSSNGTTRGFFDDLSVEATPEPSMLALGVLGGVMLARRKRRSGANVHASKCEG